MFVIIMLPVNGLAVGNVGVGGQIWSRLTLLVLKSKYL